MNDVGFIQNEQFVRLFFNFRKEKFKVNLDAVQEQELVNQSNA